MPNGLSLVEAASLPENYFTVWSNVFDRGGLGYRGHDAAESLLVHGGSSGIGITAIQLARALGHQVFATAGTADKCAACETFGAQRGINYRDEDYVEVIRSATAGRGVDVILDHVAGDYVPRDLDTLAEDGRLVLIANMGGNSANINVMQVMLRRLTITGSTLRGRPTRFKAALAGELYSNVWPLLASGRVRPVIHKTLPAHAAAEAHQLMEASTHIGKIMLDWQQ